eukprot:scaffold449_cov241-Pinguiococcus_pyrenoidosus.AAC.16
MTLKFCWSEPQTRVVLLRRGVHPPKRSKEPASSAARSPPEAQRGARPKRSQEPARSAARSPKRGARPQRSEQPASSETRSPPAAKRGARPKADARSPPEGRRDEPDADLPSDEECARFRAAAHGVETVQRIENERSTEYHSRQDQNACLVGTPNALMIALRISLADKVKATLMTALNGFVIEIQLG